MRRRFLAAVVAALLGSVFFASQALGGVFANEWYSFDGSAPTCNGEFLAYHADAHTVIRDTTDAQGASHRGVTLTTIVRATSSLTGARYIGHSQSSSQIGVEDGAGAETGTFTFSERFIMLGENGTADDMWTRSVVHFTFNASGEFVVSKFMFEFDCT